MDHIYEQLELRVGERLSEGMTNEQISEFTRIVDRVPGAADEFLQAHVPNYAEEAMFQRLVQATGSDPDDPRLKNEYAATKWLEVNRPDYRQVVFTVMEELKQEILNNRQAIVESMGLSSDDSNNSDPTLAA